MRQNVGLSFLDFMQPQNNLCTLASAKTCGMSKEVDLELMKNIPINKLEHPLPLRRRNFTIMGSILQPGIAEKIAKIFHLMNSSNSVMHCPDEGISQRLSDRYLEIRAILAQDPIKRHQQICKNTTWKSVNCPCRKLRGL